MRGQRDRERFPQLQEDIGEDPAYFLDRPLFDGTAGTSSPGLMIKQRIEGIDFLEVVNAWTAVERRLERGPRDKVIEMLEDRREYLEIHGERGERHHEAEFQTAAEIATDGGGE